MLRRSLNNMRVHVPTSFLRGGYSKKTMYGSGSKEADTLMERMENIQKRITVLQEKRNDNKQELNRVVGNWANTQIVEKKENELDKYKREFLEERAREEAFYLTPEGKEAGEREYKERADRKSYFEDFDKKYAKEIKLGKWTYTQSVDRKTVAREDKKEKAEKDSKAEKKEKKAPTGLAKWQAHLKAYKLAHPGITHKQAQKDAKASYVKATPEKKREKKQEKKAEFKHAKEEEDEPEAKAEKKAPTGLAKWNAHVRAYKLAHPGITHKQAVKDAKASYNKDAPEKKQMKKQEKKQEKEERDSKDEKDRKTVDGTQIDRKQYLIEHFPLIKRIREMKLNDFLYEYKNETGLSGISDKKLIKYWNDNREKVLDFMSLDVFNYEQYRAKMRTLWYPLMGVKAPEKKEKKVSKTKEEKAEAKAKVKAEKAEAKAKAKAEELRIYLEDKEKRAQKEADDRKRRQLEDEKRVRLNVIRRVQKSGPIGPSPAEEKLIKEEKSIDAEYLERALAHNKNQEPGELKEPPPERAPRDSNFSREYKTNPEHKNIIDNWDSNYAVLSIYQSPLQKGIEKFVEEKNRKNISVIDADFDFFIKSIGNDIIEKYGVDLYVKVLRDIAQYNHIKFYAQTFGTQNITLMGKYLNKYNKKLVDLRNIQLYQSIGKELNTKLKALTKKWRTTPFDPDEEFDPDDYEPFYT